MTNSTTIDYDIVMNDFDTTSSTKYTDTLNEYYIMTRSNCIDKENNIDIIIPTLLLTIPCGLSFLCLMSLMVYGLIKPLFHNK